MSVVHSVHLVRHVVIRGVRGMLQAPMVQLLAIATMAVCMLLLGAMMLAWTNAQTVTQTWGVDVPVTVYLVDEADPVELERLRARIGTLPEVAEVVAISPAQAMERLREGLGGDSTLLEGIEGEILPTSLEIRLTSAAPPAFAEALAARITEREIVEDVAVAGAWAARAESMLQTLADLAIGAAGLVGFACMTIVWSTIRLGVYARRSELEISRLVGGTDAFVRGPFLIEGVLQGVLGAGFALGVLWVGFDAVRPFVEHGLAMMFAAGSLRFFTPMEIAMGIALGALVGLAGARAAMIRDEGA
jgi:cell division transport system permease protein